LFPDLATLAALLYLALDYRFQVRAM
jgi:hypothetical protein